MTVLLNPYLLDTNILVAYIRRGPLGQYIEQTYGLTDVRPSPIISVVTEGEIRALVLKLGWGTPKEAALERLLGLVTVVPLPFRNTVEAYAQIDAHCSRSGLTLSKNDLWIAATAHATGARVLTTDHDFDPLDGLFLKRDWIDPMSHI